MTKTVTLRDSPISKFLQILSDNQHQTVRSLCASHALEIQTLSPTQKALLAYRLELAIGQRRRSSEEFRDLKDIANYLGVSMAAIRQAEQLCLSGSQDLIQAVEEDRMSLKSAVEALALPEDYRIRLANAAYKRGGRYRLEEVKRTLDPKSLPAGPGIGVIRGHEAIDILKRIPKNDPQRQRGFQIVKDFIRNNQ
jgi:hypothetical protein